jgi:hypothetical protein
LPKPKSDMTSRASRVLFPSFSFPLDRGMRTGEREERGAPASGDQKNLGMNLDS